LSGQRHLGAMISCNHFHGPLESVIYFQPLTPGVPPWGSNYQTEPRSHASALFPLWAACSGTQASITEPHFVQQMLTGRLHLQHQYSSQFISYHRRCSDSCVVSYSSDNHGSAPKEPQKAQDNRAGCVQNLLIKSCLLSSLPIAEPWADFQNFSLPTHTCIEFGSLWKIQF
jgi:hypothetical protein